MCCVVAIPGFSLFLFALVSALCGQFNSGNSTSKQRQIRCNLSTRLRNLRPSETDNESDGTSGGCNSLLLSLQFYLQKDTHLASPLSFFLSFFLFLFFFSFHNTRPNSSFSLRHLASTLLACPPVGYPPMCTRIIYRRSDVKHPRILCRRSTKEEREREREKKKKKNYSAAILHRCFGGDNVEGGRDKAEQSIGEGMHCR